MNSKKKTLTQLKERFAKCKGNHYVCSQSELFEELWLKNTKSNLLQKAEALNVTENFKMAFYGKLNYDMIYRFETALGFNSEFDDLIMAPHSNGHICGTRYFVHVYENGKFIDREPNDNEEDLILKVQYNLVHKVFNCGSLSSIATRGLCDKYNKLFKEAMQEAGSNIEYVYEVYKFTFLKD